MVIHDLLIDLIVRGGVEDTRLEAKAKDTKKIRGQGQPFRGQTLSRPGIGMIEAKAKDQEHKRKCSPKKKRSSQNFFRRSPKKEKKGLHKNFSSILHKKKLSKKLFKRSTKFQQFKKYCCPRAEDRPIFEDLRPRGQGQGLDLRGQGQGLQNLSSRTSSRTPPLLVIAVRLPM